MKRELAGAGDLPLNSSYFACSVSPIFQDVELFSEVVQEIYFYFEESQSGGI